MGVWMCAMGRLSVVPEPDNDLIREYLVFSKTSCPDGYREDEIFSNPWFFDSENHLISHAGKFAEPPIWYDHLKSYFFEPRGYRLVGNPDYIGEGEIGFWEFDQIQEKKYEQWKERIKNDHLDEE
ncbi:MAG: hypothetical protein J6P72_08750 [Firmicutes bacterium]|nr:hypothetical protein [Bacillota bacterium]